MDNLLSCPFCGGKAEIIDLGDPKEDSYVHCINRTCEVQQIAKYDQLGATMAWNCRSAPQPVATGDAGHLANILDAWAKAYRDNPGYRFPSDSDAEFFPIDLENAARALRSAPQPVATGERDAIIEECAKIAEDLTWTIPMYPRTENINIATGEAANIVIRQVAGRLRALASQPRSEGSAKVHNGYVMTAAGAILSIPRPEGRSDELEEWKQAASVEARLRREFLARAEKAEAALADGRNGDPATWQCHAKLRPEVSDCMWPDCGCEPRSTEIIAALVKQGWTPPFSSTVRARPDAAIENLNRHQVQCDETGEMIQVSRQALDEALAYLAVASQEIKS